MCTISLIIETFARRNLASGDHDNPRMGEPSADLLDGCYCPLSFEDCFFSVAVHYEVPMRFRAVDIADVFIVKVRFT